MRIAWERHGAGPPLLLIQGLGYARWGWEPVVEPLARSFDVILFDNRGIGESDAPAGPYTAAQMAGDALQVLDEAGVERAHVVGTSLGTVTDTAGGFEIKNVPAGEYLMAAIDRTSDGRGRVSNKTLQQLQEHDFASWWGSEAAVRR